MPFCNQNGIRSPCCPFPTLKPIIPFWLQKGMKNVKFCINRFISWKYASRAFQIRSQNVYTTSGYDFMLIFVSAKNGQKREGGLKKLHMILNEFSRPSVPWHATASSKVLFFNKSKRNWLKDPHERDADHLQKSCDLAVFRTYFTHCLQFLVTWPQYVL